MPSKQGDVGLLQEAVAQELLQSKSPAHLAYVWRDGTPRVVPIGFHWNGQEIVMATATDAPKTKVLKNGAKVAITIEHDSSPPKSFPSVERCALTRSRASRRSMLQ
ncbi:MAG: pyridoxamine 5'-phosphate oxidase family protein [Chloroflexota bacterium]|nr:pyridoxamine 5'-phosphate oxidase family protein [Chloroflexota bacterium]